MHLQFEAPSEPDYLLPHSVTEAEKSNQSCKAGMVLYLLRYTGGWQGLSFIISLYLSSQLLFYHMLYLLDVIGSYSLYLGMVSA